VGGERTVTSCLVCSIRTKSHFSKVQLSVHDLDFYEVSPLHHRVHSVSDRVIPTEARHI